MTSKKTSGRTSSNSSEYLLNSYSSSLLSKIEVSILNITKMDHLLKMYRLNIWRGNAHCSKQNPGIRLKVFQEKNKKFSDSETMIFQLISKDLE